MSKFPRLLSLILAWMLLLAAGCGSPSPSPSTPTAALSTAALTPTAEPLPVPGSEWELSAPEQQGMDSAVLVEMLEHISQENINMHSILIARNGKLVLEAYFNPHTRQTPHQIASITKSVIGALYGIAVDRGEIKDIHAPLVSFFPDKQISALDARKQAITLEHLLTLSPGLDCSDVQGTEAGMMQSKDWAQFVLDLPMKTEPGAQWSYCSSAVHLLSAVLQKTTGLDARSYANRYLFAPIGIAEVPPERWYSDPQGISGGGNGLLLTPQEIARFALLVLNGGRWGQQQVIPAAWVRDSLAPHISVGTMKEYGNMPRSYGYLWSLYPDIGLVSALGRNGQHIHLLPRENLLVVFTSATPVVSDERQFDLLLNYILPSVKSTAALPENSLSAVKLSTLVEQAAAPCQPAPAPNAVMQALDNRVIRFTENPFGWQTLSFDFPNGGTTATVSLNGLPLQMGLDNCYRVQDIPGQGPTALKAIQDGPNRLLIYESFPGTWVEMEIAVRVEGNQAILLQRYRVDGGGITRLEGTIE